MSSQDQDNDDRDDSPAGGLRRGAAGGGQRHDVNQSGHDAGHGADAPDLAKQGGSREELDDQVDKARGRDVSGPSQGE